MPARRKALRRTNLELTVIMVLCVASWFLSRHFNTIEWVYRITQRYVWFDEVLVVNFVLAVSLAVFSARR
jgi:hypothetical protein